MFTFHENNSFQKNVEPHFAKKIAAISNYIKSWTKNFEKCSFQKDNMQHIEIPDSRRDSKNDSQ